MRSLITGANGLIGSHLAEKLSTIGDEVYLISKEPREISPKLKGNCKYNFGDISDVNFVSYCIENFKPERIFHFAAQSNPTKSWLDASQTFRVNIEGTYNVLSTVCDLCPEALVIMTGSSAEYARSKENTKIKEDYNLEPSSIYGISKLANYHLSKLLTKTKNLKIIYTRPFFVIGPRKVGDVSSDFARSIIKIERKRSKVLMHGNLESIRDFVDIEDCINAFIKLSDLGKVGDIYNICSGYGTRVEDLLNEFCKLSECEIIRRVDKKLYRPVDELVRIGDPTKLELLGWERQIPLKKTLEKILNYWRNENNW